MTPTPGKFRQVAEGIVYDAPDSHSSADLINAIETAIHIAITEAVTEERETCAICAALYFDDSDGYKPVQRQTAQAIATIIRARSRGEADE